MPDTPSDKNSSELPPNILQAANSEPTKSDLGGGRIISEGENSPPKSSFAPKIILGFIILLLLGIGTFFYFSKSQTEAGGIVEFSVKGEKHHVDKMEFVVRVNPRAWEGGKIKTIPQGEKALFEFSIRPISKDRAESSKDANSYFNVYWTTETTNPEKLLQSKITKQNPDLELNSLSININFTDWSMRSPGGLSDSAWVQLDKITEDRVKGRFGGIFEFYWISGEKIEEKIRENSARGGGAIEKVEITDGTFDLPYKKLFKYK